MLRTTKDEGGHQNRGNSDHDCDRLIAEAREAAIEVDWYHTRGAELLREAADALAAWVASQGRESDRPCPHVPKGDSRRAGECHRCAVEAGWTIAPQEPRVRRILDAKPSCCCMSSFDGEGDGACPVHREPPAPQEPSKCSNPQCPLDRAHSGPCAPKGWSPDREKLIAEVEAWLNSPTATLAGARGAVRRLIGALAAQPVLDPERVKTWLQREFGSVLAHDPHNPDRFWGGSASALCEAAKRGELNADR